MKTQTQFTKILRVWFALAIALMALGALPLRTSAAPSFVVDVNYDALDSNLADGICYDGVAGCSLRAAIQQSQYDASAANITFASGINNSTIPLSNTYGTIIWSGNGISVDGGTNNITISGASLSAGKSLFQIQGSDNQLKNLKLRDATQDGVQVGNFTGTGNNNLLDGLIIFGNDAAGVYVHGGIDNKVKNSIIGTDSLSSNICVTWGRNAYDGIYVDGGADNTLIEGNRIVCSGNNGIFINGSSHDIAGTTIWFNTIGVANNGASMPNTISGIHDHETIDTLVRSNTISGNTGTGLWLDDSEYTTVLANKIGISDVYRVPNGGDGVLINNNANHNHVGSPSVAVDRNIISGNAGCGVKIADGAHTNVLDGNYIGLNEAGTAAIHNDLAGVCFINAGQNQLSDGIATVSQFISGNAREGVYIQDSHSIWISYRTFIGVDTLGNARGNGLEGVYIVDSHDITVYAGAIKNNGYAGIGVSGNTSIGNIFTPSKIAYNGGLPIDLGNDGFTANGAHSPPGPNNWMNYPSVTWSGASGIGGTTCANCRVYIYRAIGNPTGGGGGGDFVANITANASGQWSYAFPNGAFNTSLIGCSTDYNCSEMSPRFNFTRIYLPLVLRVLAH